MLFKSNGKFIDDITDSFNRFGLQTRFSEKGASPNTQKFEMYDSIHDAGYVAIAVDKPFGKEAKNHWAEVIEKDLLPSLVKESDKGENVASALIVPLKDIDMVEELLKEKGLDPTVYQLFPGYVVAGINKKDTAKLVDDFLGDEKDISLVEELQIDRKNPENTLNKTKEEALNSLSNVKDKEEKGIYHPEKRLENSKPKKNKAQDDKDTYNSSRKSPSLSVAKKLATAALLGSAIGLGAVSAPDVKDKIDTYLASPKEKAEREVMDNAVKKYFDDINSGILPDEELLEIIAENPKLASEYIRELSNTPVQTHALRNKAIDPNILREKAKSGDNNIRSAIAENPKTPEDVLRDLVQDKDNNVLKSLAKNPATPKDIIDDLSDYPAFHRDILENEGIIPEIMNKITAGKNRDCDFNKKYMANPCLSLDEIIYNAANPDECVRIGIASNPKTPKDVIEKLLNDKSVNVREAAYKHPNISEDKLNELFPENWVPSENDKPLEAYRKAALENPKINPDIHKKAIFVAPDKYAKAVAKNENIAPGMINHLKDVAEGKNGLPALIYSADNIKNNPERLSYIQEEIDKNKESIDKPVRRMLNKDFVENVYDPYKLIEDMRQVPSKKKKHNIQKNNQDKSQEYDNNNMAGFGGGVVPSDDAPPSILNDDGVAPEYFSQMPLPPLASGDISYNPEAELLALKTADDIITDLMRDTLPDIEKSIKSGAFILRDGDSGGDSSGSVGIPSLKDIMTNKTHMQNIYLTGRQNTLFEKACTKIYGLHDMYK